MQVMINYGMISDLISKMYDIMSYSLWRSILP